MKKKAMKKLSNDSVNKNMKASPAPKADNLKSKGLSKANPKAKGNCK